MMARRHLLKFAHPAVPNLDMMIRGGHTRICELHGLSRGARGGLQSSVPPKGGIRLSNCVG